MKTNPRNILLAYFFVLSSLIVRSQVATLYTFSQFQGTYTPITTGGTVFNTSAFDDQDIVDPLGTGIIPNNLIPPVVVGPGVDIGFNFVYNNYVFNRIGISNNGYIIFGNSADGANAIYESLSDWNRPISSNSGTPAKNQQRIAPLGTDLLGKSNSTIRVVTYGTAPTRSCVIQWADYQAFIAAPTGNDNINVQLWLYETSNIIDAVYGTFQSPTLDTVAQVGLRGSTNLDFNNRSVSPPNVWATSVAGTANNYFARYNTTLFPVSGQTYRWAPPQCSGVLATLSTTASVPNICPGDLFNVSLQNTYTVSGISYTWSSSTGGASGPYSTIPGPTVSNSLTALTVNVPTWYQVTATCMHSNSTATSTAFQMSVSLAPTVGASATPTSLCSGSILTLTTSGNASTYTWTGGYASGVGFAATTTTNYVVTGTSANGCTATAFVAVTVTQTPIIAPIVTPSIVCLGSSGTLTAPGAANYTWTSATQTVYTSSMVITPATQGTETYTVTKANGACVDTKMITVTTNPLPVVFAIATPTLVCSLSSSTLAVAGGQTYTWTAPNGNTFTGASPVVTPSATTIYTVAAHDGTCANVTTVMVATNPVPTINIVPSATMICRGQSVTMTANGSTSFTWTSATGTLFTNPITETPTTSIAYTAKGINNFGCTSSAAQIILVNPIPTVAITVIKPLVCSGGLSTLTASGANTYTWDANAGGVQTASAAVTSTALSSGPVVYTVTGSYNVSGCKSTKTVSVNVFVPVLTVTGNTNTCEGGNVTLVASGGNNGSYSWNTGTGNPSPGASITRSLSAPAVFTISAMTNSASIVCPASKTVALGIYSNPTITATSERTTICRFEKVELYGDGGVTYNWSNGMAGQTVTVGPVSQIQTLNYTVTGTDANGCVSTGTVQVKVSGCTGINEMTASNSELLVYPNPNNGQFVIQTSSDANLVLSNELGQLLKTITLSGANNHVVTVNDLAQGIYFISGQGIHQKIVVTK